MLENTKKQATRRRGHDFGVPQRSFLIGNIDFGQNLSKAEIIACAYGYAHCTTLRANLREVSLVGKNPEPLKTVFSTFAQWGANEDGDAIGLTFVFLSAGGYLIGITQESRRLTRRLRGYDTVLEPTQFNMIWVKKFDTRNPMLADLATYKQRLISPFLFSAAHLPGPHDHGPESVRSIPGIDAILKFEATFAQEDQVKPNTQEWGILQTWHADDDATVGKTLTTPPEPTEGHQNISDRRRTTLTKHFPVTLARLRRSDGIRKINSQVGQRGAKEWQVEQACCNLVTSNMICQKDHYEGLTDKEFPQKLLTALQERIELADGKDATSGITLKTVETQIALDGRSLLDHFKVPATRNDLETIIKQLTSEGLLSA